MAVLLGSGNEDNPLGGGEPTGWRPNMNAIVGEHDLVMVVFDSLRYDTAVAAWQAGETPNVARLLGPMGWQRRESPGTFTLAAHMAFFHGFLPTPPGRHREPRLFAMAFDGARTTDGTTCVFRDEEGANMLDGLTSRGYHTLCVGGVSFFNGRNPLGRVLPSMFAEAVWQPAFAHTQRDSTHAQVSWCVRRLAELGPQRRLFLYVNISATHVPHAMYLPGASEDSVESQRAALAYADGALAPLIEAVHKRRRGERSFWMLLADHGDAYGDDGRWGHRHAHTRVTEVPYAHVLR